MYRPREIVGLDFETFFDKGYSLKSPTLSTTQYIRDPRFKAQCVGIRTSRQRRARWYPGDEIAAVLKTFDWPNVALLAHNCAFDGLILSHHYGHVPAYYYDSLSMARARYANHIGASLDEVAKFLGYKGKLDDGAALLATKGIRELPAPLLTALGTYCAQDVDAMWDIFRAMRTGYPKAELDLIHLTINAYANPVLQVDHTRAEVELANEVAAKQKLLTQAAQILGLPQAYLTEISRLLSSHQQFPALLEARGVAVPQKISPRTGKPTCALAKDDLEFQALRAHPNAEVRTLVEARLNAKSTIGETRARRLLAHGAKPYRLPILLNYARAHTLRWSGGDKMNPQNFTRGGELRRSIRAPRGHKLGVIDSGQIEARMLAWLAQQDDLLEVFRAGGDPYCELASEIYGRKITKADVNERFVGKVGVLMLGFNAGAPRYRYTLAAGRMGPPLDISLEIAEKAVATYRRRNWKIRNLWIKLQSLLGVMYQDGVEEYRGLRFRLNGVDVPNGLALQYPRLRCQYDPRRDSLVNFEYWQGRHFTRIYGGLFCENIVQCLARIVVAEQMLKIAKKYRVVMMSHDEVAYLVPTREAKRAHEYALECFATPPAWCADLPCVGEGGFDVCYSK